MHNDTLYIIEYKYKDVYRYKERVDTIIQRDTIPQIVEVEKIVEVDKKRWWKDLLSGIGLVTIIMLIIFIAIRK
jgi:hypothetical protein